MLELYIFVSEDGKTPPYQERSCPLPLVHRYIMPSTKSRSLREIALGFTRRNTSPSPPSPTFSDATNASALDFGPHGPNKIITRSNLKSSIQALEDLVNTCANYRAALATMSRATSAFADAMQRCSGLKGPSYEASTRLQAASGIHYLIGNQWQILGEVLDKKFEKPMRQHLEAYRTVVMDRSATYERALREKSQIIHNTEASSMNRKQRNLQTFREALAVLQRQVDELDELKSAHYQQIVDHEDEVWDGVQGKVCIVVRSTMDVFDRFTAKALDPILEPMMQSVPDPFDSYGPPQSEDQIFSILAPLAMSPAQSSSASSPSTATPEPDSKQPLPSPSNSVPATWTHGHCDDMPAESAEWSHMPALPVSSSSTTPTQNQPVSPNMSHLSILVEAHKHFENSPTHEKTHPDAVPHHGAHSFDQEWDLDSSPHFQDDMNDNETKIQHSDRRSPPSDVNTIEADSSLKSYAPGLV